MTILRKRDRHIDDTGSQATLSVRFIRDDILDEADAPIATRQIRYVNSIAGRYNLATVNCPKVLNVGILFYLFPDSFALRKSALIIVFVKLAI